MENHLNNNNNIIINTINNNNTDNQQFQNPNSIEENIEEFETDPFQTNPNSPQNTSFLGPISNPFSDAGSDIIHFDDDFDQINFVTDLFSPNHHYSSLNFATFGAQSHNITNFVDQTDNIVTFGDQTENIRNFGVERENIRNFGVESDNLGNFGDESENIVNFGDQSENISNFGDQSENIRNIGELSENMVRMGGMRIIGIESESDSEGFIRDDSEELFADSNLPIFWNNHQNQVGVNLDLEWEEVGDQRILERGGLGSVIERIEELSVSSEISNFEREELQDGLEEGDRDLEWEFLLAVNNLGRNLELEDESFGEYDELFGQLMQNGGTSKGSPPTAKSFVENLPIVVLSEEELKKDNIVCAVCKDDLSVEGSVTRLPCSHLYHEDCIVPWLCIRNTCPVCRHELPTDDADYERRKSQEEGADMSQDLLIRYAFEPIF